MPLRKHSNSNYIRLAPESWYATVRGELAYSPVTRVRVHSMHSRKAQFISRLPWWHCIAPHCILIIDDISICYSTVYLAVVLRYYDATLFAGEVDKGKGHS